MQQSQERVSSTEAVLAEFRQRLDEARAAYRNAVGLEPFNLRFPGRLRGLPASKDEALAVALRHNPTVKAADADAKAARHGFDATFDDVKVVTPFFRAKVRRYLGPAGGLLLVWLLDRYQFIRIPGDVYFIDRLPVAFDWVDISVIVILSMLISFAATIYPARQAARLYPIDAIRHE